MNGYSLGEQAEGQAEAVEEHGNPQLQVVLQPVPET